MINDGLTYTLEKIDMENKVATISRFDDKHKIKVIIEFTEDESTEKRWDEFWDVFAQNEARKIN